MNGSLFTQAFPEWAALIRYRLVAQGDTWLITDYGETSYQVSRTDGTYTLTEKQRGAEQFLMSAADGMDIERYLTVLLGDDIRACAHMPRITRVSQPSDLCPDCDTIVTSYNRLTLVDAHGKERGIFCSPIDIADRVIWFSWILDASLEDLCASYLDPDGLPLFPGCKIGPHAS